MKMKVAVLGASGWIGSHIVEEAKSRGHDIVALVRDPKKIDRTDIEVRRFDLSNAEADLSDLLRDVDAVIASIGGRAAGKHEIVVQSAKKLLETIPTIPAERLLWVGGAGSLEVAPNIKLVTVPEFPHEYKAEALAQGDALDLFKQSTENVNWTFVSPAAEIFPGEAQAKYRIGGDQLLTDANGDSKISVADYAIAMIDELEAGQHPKQRIGVAY